MKQYNNFFICADHTVHLESVEVLGGAVVGMF